MRSIIFLCLFSSYLSFSQTLLKPDRVFDGTEMHDDWVILVEDNLITYAGKVNDLTLPSTTKEIDLSGTTLMPGIIEGHSHILLHPYNETDWNDQVLRESPIERAIRGTVHVKNSLLAGVTTMRDLGAEGAGY
ncbi:MAG: hypothetical protein ABJJ05_03850, partial [Maribacter litoralis]|uniref:amidohydrolase family protein n=1 Tax=Maribacter litoralis TaxID=2059726 RepID=UPI00329EAC5F